MPLGVADEFDAEELAMLANLRKADEQQAAGPDAAAPNAAPAATAQPSEQPTATQGQEQPAAAVDPAAAAAPAAPAQPTEAPQGDPRAALRASRRAERQARERAAQLEAELETLRKQVPRQPATNPDDLTDAELAELEQDFPAMAKAARLARTAAAATAAQQPTAHAPTQQPEFLPPVLPPELQDVVDGIPDLLTWQCDPDQTRFNMAKAMDGALLSHPKWKDAPPDARLAEVARRVNVELGAAPAPQPSPSQQQPAATAAQVIASVPRQTPNTLSDIGAGGAGDENPLTLERMEKMSEDDLLAALARL